LIALNSLVDKKDIYFMLVAPKIKNIKIRLHTFVLTESPHINSIDKNIMISKSLN